MTGHTVPVPSSFWLKDVNRFRPGQFEAAEEIAESSRRVVVLEGPPGSGKSIVALVAAQLWGLGNTNILTATKQLQRQYDSYRLPIVGTVWGRNGYPCERLRLAGFDESCEGAPCKLELTDNLLADTGWCKFKEYGGCAYYDARDTALDLPIRVLNYAYFMSTPHQFAGYGRDDIPRNMLIADESHLAEGAVLSAAEVRVSYSTLAELYISKPPLNDLVAMKSWLDDASNKIEGAIRQATTEDDWKRRARLLRLRENVRGLGHLEDKTVETHIYGVIARKIWGADVAEELLWNHSGRIVLMSATPGSDWYIDKTVGLRVEQRIVIDSIFPVSNRPCFIWPIAPLSYKSTPEDKDHAFRVWDWIISKYKGKGIIHTSSYKLAGEYARNSGQGRRILYHDSKGAALAVKSFLDSDPSEGRVLVSPVVGTGFDCSELAFQVIAKIPFPDLGDKVVAARKEDLPGIYGSQAALTVVQMYGRAVRNETWRGDTWITDSNVVRLMKSQKAMLSKYFTDAVRWVSGGID